MGLILPRTIFLDTWCLADLARVRQNRDGEIQPLARMLAVRAILLGLQQGYLHPVIGWDQPYEWVRESRGCGLERADVLDTASKCFEASTHVMTFMIEAANEARRIFGLTAEVPPPLRDIRAEDGMSLFLRRHVPEARQLWEGSHEQDMQRRAAMMGHRLGVRQFRSVRNLVEISADVHAAQPELNNAEMPSFRIGVDETVANMAQESRAARSFLIARLRNHPYLVPVIQGMGGPADLSPLWAGLQFANCPAMNLWCGFWWRFVKSQNGRGPEPSDPTDVSMLPAYSYADFSVVDKRTYARIIEADQGYKTRVFPNPETLLASGLLELPVVSQ